ncbi:MAG: ABC transporter permease [Bifidobacteriaceae bacterium]|jgi:ABC-2 type transport system permease protein|nr:ABC transporter permease [Bifidobacteriaceae bacterium]
MPAFRTALRLIVRQWPNVLLYVIGLGMLGVFILANINLTSVETFSEAKPNVAVIDRDHSALSEGLTDYLATRSTPVALEDNTVALQDATAKNTTPYIVIVPAGFGDAFQAAVADGAPAPTVETVVNYLAFTGQYMDQVTNAYLNAVRMVLSAEPDTPLAEALSQAAAATDQQVPVEVVEVEGAKSIYYKAYFFFRWMAYPLTAGLMVLVGMVFSTFMGGEVRRRNLASPLAPGRMSTQVAFACVALVLFAWLFMMVLTLIPATGGLDLLQGQPARFGILAVAALIYALVPLAIGFLVAQTGMRAAAQNGVANIVSLGFAFLSGIFMDDLSLMGDTVLKVAHATPTFWFAKATFAVQDGDPMSTFWGYNGIVLLFAVAIFAVGLLVGRLRTQTADAGGNLVAAPAAA